MNFGFVDSYRPLLRLSQARQASPTVNSLCPAHLHDQQTSLLNNYQNPKKRLILDFMKNIYNDCATLLNVNY